MSVVQMSLFMQGGSHPPPSLLSNPFMPYAERQNCKVLQAELLAPPVISLYKICFSGF